MAKNIEHPKVGEEEEGGGLSGTHNLRHLSDTPSPAYLGPNALLRIEMNVTWGEKYNQKFIHEDATCPLSQKGRTYFKTTKILE